MTIPFITLCFFLTSANGSTFTSSLPICIPLISFSCSSIWCFKHHVEKEGNLISILIFVGLLHDFLHIARCICHLPLVWGGTLPPVPRTLVRNAHWILSKALSASIEMTFHLPKQEVNPNHKTHSGSQDCLYVNCEDFLPVETSSLFSAWTFTPFPPFLWSHGA